LHHIYIMSDGTGQTAEQALRAALAQFSDHEVMVERRAGVRTVEQARGVLEDAVNGRALVVHTIVSHELRRAILDICRLYDIETVDLMGPLLARLATRFATSPSETPGLFRELNRHYFQRIESMEFALRHDDGQRTGELEKAEIVLVGVSRTFKTPLSVYLAFRGWLVGNVPIVLDLPVPEVLFKLPEHRVFGLTTTAQRLATLRHVRHQYLGGSAGDYANLEFVRRELAYARDVFARRPDWPVIDVTDKPIEEIAAEILGHMREASMEKT
jgi:[pyruvate, water dikinase]-phosphate phosphotransferase / [pyruvate, water dikinase] kinase